MKAPLNAERLAECRRKMGITKLEASKRMRLTQSGYLRYESGERRPTYPTIYEMANVLNTSAAYLLGETDDPKPDRVVISKKADPKLFRAAQIAQELRADQIDRLLAYTRELKKEKAPKGGSKA